MLQFLKRPKVAETIQFLYFTFFPFYSCRNVSQLLGWFGVCLPDHARDLNFRLQVKKIFDGN